MNECEHWHIVGWDDPETGDADALWSCAECGLRFVPITEAEALRADNLALRQDAERWRFMRSNYGHMTSDMLNGKLRIHVEPRRWGVVTPEDADSAIDAAMKATLPAP